MFFTFFRGDAKIPEALWMLTGISGMFFKKSDTISTSPLKSTRKLFHLRHIWLTTHRLS